MSQNNLPANLPSIEKLIARIKSAEKTNTKEIKITIQEGKELIYDLALITSKLASVVSDLNQNIKDLRNLDQKIDVKFDGGNF